MLLTQIGSAATYTVTNTLDSGVGSLRDALITVNAGAGGDTIVFSGVSGTIALSSTLAITKSVAISGPGANLLTISGNDAVRVFNVAAGQTFTISGLTIAHGHSSTGGGGILVGSGATLTVSSCVFSNNAASNGASSVGGAISNSSVNLLTVNDSTFVGNKALPGGANPVGGAIYTAGPAEVDNSTFFGNSTPGNGAAIYIIAIRRLTMKDSTIVGNSSMGGDAILGSTSQLTISNSIISGNTGGDCSKCSTTGTNFIGGTAALGPLQNNGGPTPTMMPLTTGAGIIGSGLNSTLATDQRGFARATSGASDLGAVQTYNLTVTTLADITNGGTTCTGGDTCSLRDAINLGNSHDSGDIIPLSGLQGTITLTSPLPDITTNINISGPGANLLTISGGNTYPVFQIANTGTANISGVTIANGNGGAPGGAGITNLGALLTLSNCELNNNHAAGQDGGGLFNSGVSTATVTDCTFSGNSSDSGGAINNNGNLAVTNSTFIGNTSQADLGGGIFNQRVAAIASSTITGNTAASQGGGIENIGTITVTNSVVAGNTEAGSLNDDCSSCGTQSASNLFSTAGTPVTAAQVMLAPLAYYGLNQTVRTMLPLPGSPVIQAGDPTLLPSDLSTDERLLPRTIGGKLDLGAVEANYISVQFVQQPSSTTVNLTMSPAVTMSVAESGTTVANIPLPITFVGSGALHGTLNKATQIPAVPGDPALASFNDLSGDTVGTGDTLTSTITVTPPAVSPPQTLTATSNPFDITALTPATITFSPAPPTSVVYGTAPITLNGAAYASGSPTGQTVTYQVVSGPGSITGKTLTFVGVGTVIVNASIAANGSYAAGSASFNIVVTPAPLAITVADASRAVGAPNPAFSSTASGLVNGDALDGSITVTYSTTATVASPAGTYPISAVISGSAAGNYTVTIVNGTLTVTAQAAVLDFTLTLPSSGSQTVIPGNAASYAVRVAPTNTAYPGTVTFTATGLPAGDTISFTPATVAANAGMTPSNVSVQTAPQLAASNLQTKSLPILLGVLILPFAGSRRMRKGAGRYLWILIVILGGAAVTTGLTGCGTGNGFFGQIPQTYNITITATSGTIQHSVNVTLNVQ
ncbi:MAG: beta strand repeat-containing protein [Acidobacteriaceae bacterium]